MSTDRLLSLISIALGLVGFFVAYIFYKKSLRIKLPMYAVYTSNLIQNSVSQMSGLEISYKGHCVSVVSVSKIIFWNAGSETLSSLDIVTANPLRICCLGDVQLLDAEVLLANNQSSQVSVEKADSGNEAIISFDYLDNNQGAVIQVVHTGLVSAGLAVRGDFKGARLAALNTSKSGTRFHAKHYLLFMASCCAIYAYIVIAIIRMLDFNPFSTMLLLTLAWLAPLSAGFWAILFTSYPLLLGSSDSRVPRGLRSFSWISRSSSSLW